jgi:hypothetical protein
MQRRLAEQARRLTHLIFHGTYYNPSRRIKPIPGGFPCRTIPKQFTACWPHTSDP